MYKASNIILPLTLCLLGACGGSDSATVVQAEEPEAKTENTTPSTEVAESEVPKVIEDPAQLATLSPMDAKSRVKLTAEQWEKILKKDQYYILRTEGTERAFTGDFWESKKDGVYSCAACGLHLYDSRTKFDSGTGWPSFFEEVAKGHVTQHEDNSLGMVRVEVECARCGGHLGHVFPDGPQPTGLRHCINSAALKFAPREKAEEKAAPETNPSE